MSMEQDTPIRSTPFEAPDLNPETRRKGPSRLTILLSMAAIALFVIGWFLFTASAVQFDWQPKSTSFAITKGWHYPLGDRLLIRPGTIEIKAFAEGYAPIETTVTIEDVPSQSIQLALEPLPGIVTLSANTAGAEILMDGQRVGVTPLERFDVSAGLHKVRLRHPRFVTGDFEIEVTGRRIEQSFDLNLEPAWAEITVSTTPTAADVAVDDEVLALTPATLPILEGQRRIRFSRPGYKSKEIRLDIERGVAQTLATLKLEPADATLSVTTQPSGASIQINGEYRGQSPLTTSVAPDETLSITAKKAGFDAAERDLSLSPNETRSLALDLTPRLGVLAISVIPRDADILLDGVAAPQLTLGQELLSKPYELTLKKAGYADINQRVTPIAGQTTRLTFELLSVEAAKLAKMPAQIKTHQGGRLQLIEPGEVALGAPRRARGRRSNEIERQVTVTRPFYLGQFEVTNREFLAFDPSHEPGLLGRILLSEGDRPVVNLAWSRAVEFCNWLSQKEQLEPAYSQVNGEWRLTQPVTNGYRLPTESEWALALAAVDENNVKPTFPWGESLPPPPRFANIADESARGAVPYVVEGYDDGYRGPAPVGKFPANRWGLFDLVGNAAEWVNDRYSVAASTAPEMDRTGPETGDLFVIRGSSFLMGRFGELRSAYREFGQEGRQDVGFRLARSIPEDESP
ncbi:MAG: PEGA domain-containing protein [Pseudomonadales bacterium]